MKKPVFYIFFAFVLLSLLTPLLVFSQLLFPYITGKAFYFRICVELAIPFYIYLVVADRTLRPKLANPLNIAVISFLAINIVSAIFGVSASRSLWGNFERMGGVYYLAHLAAFCFFVQLLGQAKSDYLKRFLQAFILVAVVVTLNGLSGWFGGPSFVADPSLPERVSSTFGNPIFFASYLIIPMFLSAYFAAQEDKKSLKITYLAFALIQLLGIYSSGTRGAVLGLIAGVFVSGIIYIILTDKAKIKRYGLIATGIFIVMSAILFANYNKLPQGSGLNRIFRLRDSNTESRLIQWKLALTGYKEHPLLGVGSENYYIISNKYFNPDFYKYDPSWFDKPHNYLIEVLTTNGILGLLAYFGIFSLGFYGLFKAFRASLLGLGEMSLLVGAIVTYQAQNLTVFDTVSSSMAFYAFVGFCSYVWINSVDSENEYAPVNTKSSIFATPLFVVSCLVILFTVYASNVVSIEASKRVNFGFVYREYDAKKAAAYYESALSLPFNLDSRETANRYSDFVSFILSNNNKKNSPDFLAEQLEKATNAQREITEQTQNDPLLWMRLAVDEMNQAVVKNQDFAPSEVSIQKAIALAPKRVELLQLQIQYDNFKKDWKDAVKVAEQIVQLNPYSPGLRWQLAISYYLDGRTDDAARQGDLALAAGYKNSRLEQFAWYIEYYLNKKDFVKAVPLLEQAVELQPNEIGLYFDLAKAYAGIGDKDHAIALARQVEQFDPSQKAKMEAFINSLK